MLDRPLRLLAFLSLGAVAAYVTTRAAEQRRDDRRLDHPVAFWPDVAVPAEVAVPADVAVPAVEDGAVGLEPTEDACPRGHPVTRSHR